MPRLKAALPGIKIIVRADSGFAREHIMEYCEKSEICYVFGLARNARLEAELAPAMDTAHATYESTQEPVRVFEEILLHDESVLSFLHADYVMVNERLARHYGLAGVVGNHFRRVPLPLGYRRGGLLTQAGTLMMNSDYPDSHPLKRGKWLLESLLNDPPHRRRLLYLRSTWPIPKLPK